MKGVLANQVHVTKACQKFESVWRYCGGELFIRAVICFGLSAIFLGFISYFNKIDHDLFHQISLFREVIKTGKFPHQDIFSYTSPLSTVVHHEWGAGAIIYLLIVKQGLGDNALIIFKYLITIFICTGVYIFAIRQGASIYAFSFIAFWGILLGRIGFTTIRAQLFSLMFLLAVLFLIEENRKGKKWPLLAVMPLYTVWVNIHGGFLIGLGLFGIYIFELFLSCFLRERDLVKSLTSVKYQIVTFIAMGFLTFLNPYGINFIPTILHAITLDRTPFITEWRPIWQVCQLSFNSFLLSIIILLYIFYKNKYLWVLPGFFMLVATAWQTLWHYRHMSIYAVLFVCYLPVWLEDTELSDLLKRYKKLVATLFLLIGLLGILTASSNKFWQLHIPTKLIKGQEKGKLVYPVGAVRYLQEFKFSGNMMTFFNDGAYISWHLFPKVKVGMDSRFEAAYTVEQVAENADFYEAKEGWQTTLDRYPTDAILVRHWQPIEKALDQHSQENSLTWTKVYVDDTYSLYLRRDLAEKYPFLDNRGKTIVGTFP
jgi:hypothetical protein